MCQELSLLFYINSLSSQESREEGILTSILQIRKMGLDDVWGSSEFTWLQSGGAQDFHSPSSGFSTGRFCPFYSANIGADTCYVTDTLDAVWASLRPAAMDGVTGLPGVACYLGSGHRGSSLPGMLYTHPWDRGSF